MIKRLLNDSGNTLTMVMLSIAALSATTYGILDQLNTSKKSVKNIQLKKNQELIEYKLMALLSDETICTKNFENKLPNSIHTELKRNDSVFLKVGNTYSGGTIKVTNISTTKVTNEKYDLNIEYDKKLPGSNKFQKIKKKFDLKGSLDPTNSVIKSCYLDYNNSIEDAVNAALTKVCNGPGVYTSNSTSCKVVSYETSGPVTCNPGEAIASYNVDSNGKLTFKCQPYVNFKVCKFGMKLSGILEGKFECFELEDMIDQTELTISNNSTCKVILSAAKKYKLECSDAIAQTCECNTDKSTVACGQPVKDSCGNACTPEVLGTLGIGTLNNSECADPNTIACDEEIKDSCGNICPEVGKKDCPSNTANKCPSMEYGTGITTTIPEGDYGELLGSSDTFCGPSGYTCGCGVPAPGPFAVMSAPSSSSAPTTPISWNCEPKEPCPTNDTNPIDNNNGGGAGCFIAGTQVSMYDGSKKNIEDVTTEDVLMGTSGEKVKVMALMRFDRHSYKYSFNGSKYFATGGHPFKTVDGWKVFDMIQGKIDNPKLKIKPIKVGDAILTENGFEIVRYFSKVKNWERVYNFEVDGKHEYIADGYYVHNRAELPTCFDDPTGSFCSDIGYDDNGDQYCIGLMTPCN